MGINVERILRDIEGLSSELKRFERDKEKRLESFLPILPSIHDAARKLESAKTTWLLSEPLEEGLRFKPGEAPESYRVIGVDGSHLEPEKDFYPWVEIINVGKVLIEYGDEPYAIIESEPFISIEKEERFPGYTGVKRMVKEVEVLLSFLKDNRKNIKTLCLLDGSLILWTLSGKGVPEEERRRFILQGLLPCLDELEKSGALLASYISLPRTKEVANLLRINICPYSPPDCDKYCRFSQRKCDELSGIEDREIFSKILQNGERSPTFRSLSPIVTKYYGKHQINFFYIKFEDEVGRVEFPSWCSPHEIHALILEELKKGMGYPIPLLEAHEEAFIRREEVIRFLEEHLDIKFSSKERAKRARWI